MHVGMVCSTPCPPSTGEGISHYVYNLACKLIDKGHKVTIMTRGGLTPNEECVNKALRVFRVPLLPICPFHVHLHGLFLNRLVKSLEPELDILHAHSPYVPPVATELPLLTTIHTLERAEVAHYEASRLRQLSYRMSAEIFSSLERQLFEDSDALTAVSSRVFRDLNTYYGIKREGLIVGNGVDEKTFLPANDRSEMKRAYVLYVGRIGYRKGLFDLMNCAKHVCEERPDVSFLLTGQGPLMGLLSKEAARMGIERNVVLCGYVDNDRLIDLYQNASVCVVPSSYEGLPTVMLEAMACGIPVVATSIPGHIEVISQGSNGFLVPVGSSEEMANTILGLLADEELQRRVGRAARQTIEENYTWDKISGRVLECYGGLLEKVTLGEESSRTTERCLTARGPSRGR
jgi:glycosyltransferase involved in cell wall biosynthesis